jgi:hypothetical protein
MHIGAAFFWLSRLRRKEQMGEFYTPTRSGQAPFMKDSESADNTGSGEILRLATIAQNDDPRRIVS